MKHITRQYVPCAILGRELHGQGRLDDSLVFGTELMQPHLTQIGGFLASVREGKLS